MDKRHVSPLISPLAERGARVPGHAVLLDVVLAQLDPPLGKALREFDWMRRLRNDSAYPSPERNVASAPDVQDAFPAAEKIIEIAARVIEQMPVYQ